MNAANVVESVRPERPEAEGAFPPSRLAALWRNAIGKKALMAATGIVMFLYVLVHMLANLQVYAGPGAIDRYAALLHATPPLLWTARVVLLAAVAVHAVAGVQLYFQKRRARPVAYSQHAAVAATAASRTMIWSGALIFLFVVYHLLDLTTGAVNPGFEEGHVFRNVVASFARAGASIAYLVAMLALAFHLWHGLWSMFQSLGASSSRVTVGVKRFAAVFATLVAVGFASIPLAIVFGLLR